MLSSRPIVIAHSDRGGQRVLHRMLAAVRQPIEAAGTPEALAQALEAAPTAVVVADIGLAQARPELAASAPLATWVAVPGEGTEPAAPAATRALLRAGWRHVIAHPMPMLAEELVSTVQKLFRGDLFGLEKYLVWAAAVRELALDDAGGRDGVVAELVRDVVSAGLSERVASLASVIADELLSNALYVAPVDEAGRRVRADEARGTPRALSDRDLVTLRWACDGRYLAVEVRDRWGSLDPAPLGPLLATAGTRSPREGGMGLALVYACSHQLVIDLDPGRLTEVIAMIDVRFKPTELGRSASFHFFARGGAA